jgi:hypothetical protein
VGSPEVEWALDQWASVVEGIRTDYGVDLYRVDRDRSVQYDGSRAVDMSRPVQSRTNDLKRGVFAGAGTADRSSEVRGPGYNQNVETVVGCRFEGFSGDYGHIAPGGDGGIPFMELVRRCRTALWDAADAATDAGELLGVGSPDGRYFTLDIANESPAATTHAEYFRYDFDLLLIGEKDY